MLYVEQMKWGTLLHSLFLHWLLLSLARLFMLTMDFTQWGLQLTVLQ
jgi:hypothetical protein